MLASLRLGGTERLKLRRHENIRAASIWAEVSQMSVTADAGAGQFAAQLKLTRPDVRGFRAGGQSWSRQLTDARSLLARKQLVSVLLRSSSARTCSAPRQLHRHDYLTSPCWLGIRGDRAADRLSATARGQSDAALLPKRLFSLSVVVCVCACDAGLCPDWRRFEVTSLRIATKVTPNTTTAGNQPLQLPGAAWRFRDARVRHAPGRGTP